MLVCPDMFLISSTTERSLLTNFDQRSFILAHYKSQLSLSLSFSASRCVSHYLVNLPCDGGEGEESGGSRGGEHKAVVLTPPVGSS